MVFLGKKGFKKNITIVFQSKTTCFPVCFWLGIVIAGRLEWLEAVSLGVHRACATEKSEAEVVCSIEFSPRHLQTHQHLPAG